jgi:hypothetical protein
VRGITSGQRQNGREGLAEDRPGQVRGREVP